MEHWDCGRPMLARPTACGSVWTVSAERPCPPPRLKLSVRSWTPGHSVHQVGTEEKWTQFCLDNKGLLISASDTVSSIDRQTLLNLPKLAGCWLRLSQTKQAQIVTLRAWKILILVFDCPQGFLYSDRSVLDCVQIFEMMRIFIALFIVHLSRNISNIAVQ